MKVYPFVKRTGDVLLSVFLLIVLSPIYLLLWIAIRLQDGGPAIFKQIRIGRGGMEFMFYKFRSMPVQTPNVESRETEKLKVTPLGIFLRLTNLDELPQFVNVLKGDMSFIGPRPPIPSQTSLIALRRENKSLGLRPGLTGWAQVNSFDGMSTEKKAEFDGVYAERISFRFDLLILVKTIGYFTRRPPTY